MDGNSLMVSFAFGMVGMGMFLFGRKAGRLVPLGAGLVLMTVPYFIANLAILLVTCCALTILPFVVRDA